MSDNSKPTQNAALSFEQWLGKAERLDGAAAEGPCAEDGSLIGPRPGASVAQVWGVRWKADSAFIAHARTALPAAVAALRAVADLHQPRNRVTRSASGHLVDTPGPCTDCDWDWPCPTIQAATSAIGVQVWSQKTG